MCARKTRLLMDSPCASSAHVTRRRRWLLRPCPQWKSRSRGCAPYRCLTVGDRASHSAHRLNDPAESSTVSHLCPPRTMQTRRAIIELASFHSPPVVAISNLHVPAVICGTLIRGARATVHPAKKPLDLPIEGAEHVSRRRTAGHERVDRPRRYSQPLHHREEQSGHARHFRIARTE